MATENAPAPPGMIEPEDIEDEAGDLWFAYQQALSPDGSQGDEKLQAFFDYLPEKGEMAEKTVIDPHQTRALTQLMMVPRLDPEFTEGDVAKVDDMIQLYLQLQTSVEGRSRQEFVEILKSLAGGRPDYDEETGGPGIILKGFGAQEDDED